ncbi:response regulator PleD [Posidoniimonas corsicana]|uniref:Response regulator PleD n=1 Tax=Posidoniimonas corsicana TaxID=1938618 RepID=A0A5C5VER1_9BACT|nr:diguanylate cyclase [Posidoniimonas corsicana]TWT37118.1 response regulator PleD [Posidoniimonas corsicana]
MASEPNAIDVTIVSTDPAFLKETAWTLSVFGYRATASTDWSEEAAWQQSTRPGVTLLDLRETDADDLATLGPRGAGYSCRIAIADQHAQVDDALLGLVDDVIAYPVNSGELLSRVRTAARRLEFERRFQQAAVAEPGGGMLTRRGLTAALGRGDSSDAVLALLAVDFFDVIVHEHGQHAAHRLLNTLGRRVHQQLGAEAEVATAAPGVFGVLFRGGSLEDAQAAVQRVVSAFSSSETIARETRSRPSLSAVVARCDADLPPDELLQRAESALEYASCYGGGRVLEVATVEAELDAWRDRVENGALLQSVAARHVMAPLPLAIGQDRLPTRLDELRRAADQKQTLPDCVPVVGADGAVTGVVNLPLLQRSALTRTAVDDADLVTDQFWTCPAGAALSDVLNAFSEHQTETLVVVEDALPVGYITCNAVTELYTSAVDAGAYRRQAPVGRVEDLAVPLARPESRPPAVDPCEDVPTVCETAV